MAFIEAIGGAATDIREGFRATPLWWRLGIDSTVARYRRTILGPFWMASSTIATGFALSIVFGTIFGGDWRHNFPFILAGVLSFNLASGLIADGAQVFMNSSGIMQVRNFPLSFYSLLMCDKAVINFVHQLVAFLVITFLFRVGAIPNWTIVLTLPLVVLIGLFASFPLGMISTRYRDVSYFIMLILQSMFMLTPVFWPRSQMPAHFRWIVTYNPFAYMVEVLRQPLIGHPAAVSDIVACCMFLAVAVLLAIVCLALFRRRVTFWL